MANPIKAMKSLIPESVQKEIETNGQYSPELISIYSNLEDLMEREDNFQKAGEYLDKNEKILEMAKDVDPLLWANYYNQRGSLYSKQLGDNATAKDYYLKELGIRKQFGPASDPNLAIAYHDLGWIHIKLEQYETALQYLDSSLTIIRKLFPDTIV